MKILAFVGMLRRLCRSGSFTLEVSPAFVVLPSKHSLSLVHYLVSSCPLFHVVAAYFPVAQPPYSFPSGLFISSTTMHTRVQLLVLNSQCKATMAQLALAPWDNSFFPFVLACMSMIV